MKKGKIIIFVLIVALVFIVVYVADREHGQDYAMKKDLSYKKVKK